ncbi:MAG: MBL fold metallo-hydrolase [Pseudomonadota bacterium]|nr:MBL fold metallo-hydrolase [Pseudomonadota bacterium]
MSTTETPKVASAQLAFNREMNFEYGVIQQLVPGVRRLVARNAGPFTFKGTNTYIVGRGNVCVIDPGPEDKAHLEALLTALRGERVTHILVTHTHLDHTGNVAALKHHTGAEVAAYGPVKTSRGVRTTSPSGEAFVDKTLEPDRRVTTGDTIRGNGWSIDVLHTPGHAPDHLCFAYVGQRTVFSGDHVMGWNTTVVAPPEGNMGDYIASLELLLPRNDRVFFPGHGGRIQLPQRVVRAYLMHRRWREQSIIACLEDGLRFIPQIVSKMYSHLDPSLAGAAALSVLAHLEFLIERGLVVADQAPPAIESAFSLPRP